MNLFTEFPLLTHDTKTFLLQKGSVLSFAENEVIVKPEKYTQVIPLVLDGLVKVIRVDNQGNELFLYYIHAGQSCALSLSTCLSRKPSEIKAIAEENTKLIAIPMNVVIELFNDSSDWRDFVMQTINERFEELIKVIDNIAFMNTDHRLANFLTIKTEALHTNYLHITHQEIATELGTSREIISRLLKKMEQKGQLKLGRNNIKIISLV